jgi:hypothetical protein
MEKKLLSRLKNPKKRLGMPKRLVNKYNKMTRREKDVSCLALLKLVDHLEGQIKEAKNDPDAYRRREALRCGVAISYIQQWSEEANKFLDKKKKT